MCSISFLAHAEHGCYFYLTVANSQTCNQISIKLLTHGTSGDFGGRGGPEGLSLIQPCSSCPGGLYCVFTWGHVRKSLTVMICLHIHTHAHTSSQSHAKTQLKRKKKSSQVLKYLGLREIKIVLVLKVKYNHSWRNKSKN